MKKEHLKFFRVLINGDKLRIFPIQCGKAALLLCLVMITKSTYTVSKQMFYIYFTKKFLTFDQSIASTKTKYIKPHVFFVI